MTEQRKILVIINPTSGQMKSKRAVFDIIDYFSQVGVIPTVLSTTKRGDATTYVLQNAAEYDVVVCCGGDGTLNEVITGMMQIAQTGPHRFCPMWYHQRHGTFLATAVPQHKKMCASDPIRPAAPV